MSLRGPRLTKHASLATEADVFCWRKGGLVDAIARTAPMPDTTIKLLKAEFDRAACLFRQIPPAPMPTGPAYFTAAEFARAAAEFKRARCTKVPFPEQGS